MAEDWSAFPAVAAAPDEWAAFPKVQAPPAPTWGETAIDAAKGIGKGLAQGAAAIPGMVGDAATGLNSGIDSVEQLLGASPPALAPGKYTPNTQNISDLTRASSLPDATTGIGKTAQNVAQFIPGALTPGGEGSWIAKALKFGVAPGLASEGAGALADAGGASPGTKAATQLAASLLAPGVAGRVVSPLQNKNAGHAMDIADLVSEGVKPTAGQAVDSEGLRTLESVIGSSKINEKQGKKLTNAAFQRVGMDVPDGIVRSRNGTPGTIDKMMTDAGADYDGIAARNTFRLDGQGATELNDIHSKYAAPGPYTPDTTNAINGTLTRVRDLLQAGVPGKISGPDYIAMRSNIRAAARNADPQRAEGLNDIVNSLDAAFERNLSANSPDAGALPAANRNYRNALVLQHAAAAAGADTAKGTITPANLASAAKSIYGKGSYVRGYDDFSDLAGPAVSSLARIPDSGTSKRLAVLAGLGSVTGAAGYALGSKYNTDTGNDSPIAGLLLGEGPGAGLLAAAIARPLLMNRLTQGYLKNQAMTHTPGLLSLPGAMTAANGTRGLLSSP
jgi:hypothetical protein